MLLKNDGSAKFEKFAKMNTVDVHGHFNHNAQMNRFIT